jgi:imidazolonepropionase-like amidohydrolase
MMAANATRLLSTGVTTVRDLGDRGGLAMRLRDLVAGGALPGPRIVAAGPPLTLPGGHCWFLGGEAAGAEGLRAAIERNARAGADLIKVMATGGHLTPDGPAMGESQYTQEELRLVVAEAARFGLPVAAHAHGTQGIADAVAAGVSTIEHCTWLGNGGFDVPEAVIEEMRTRRTTVSPALSRNWRGFPQRFGAEATEQLLSRLRWYDERGIPMIAGTDAGVPGAAFDKFVSALEVFRHVGLSNDRILELATTAAAEALGLIKTTGHITVDTDADLLVVDGNPLADLDALRNVRLVAARGRLHVPADAGKAVVNHGGRGNNGL